MVLDHELQRQAARAGQRRQLEGGDALRRRCRVHFLLQFLLQLRAASLRALVPGLEQHAADALVDRRHAGDLEHLVVFGQLVRDLEHLPARRCSSARGVAFGGPRICASTMPWSSCGASSDFARHVQ